MLVSSHWHFLSGKCSKKKVREYCYLEGEGVLLSKIKRRSILRIVAGITFVRRRERWAESVQFYLLALYLSVSNSGHQKNTRICPSGARSCELQCRKPDAWGVATEFSIPAAWVAVPLVHSIFRWVRGRKWAASQLGSALRRHEAGVVEGLLSSVVLWSD